MNVHDRHPVPADAHPIRCARKHDPVQARPDKGPLFDMPVDAISVRRVAHHFVSHFGPQGSEEPRTPVPTSPATDRAAWLPRRLGCSRRLDLIPAGLGRSFQSRGDRLAGEAEHRKELDQPATLAGKDRTKQASAGLVISKDGRGGRLTNRPAVETILQL